MSPLTLSPALRFVLRTGCAIALMVPIGASSARAARLKPPSEAIKEPQNVVAVVEVIELRPDTGGTFDVIDVLHGESGDRVDARFVASGPEPLSVGDRAIVGYSSLQRSVRVRNAFEPDPAGPRIVEIPSVGYAILEDSASIRVLTSDAADDQPQADAQILVAILDQVRRPHVQSRRFVLSELVLRPNLLDLLDDDGFATLRQVLLSGALEPMANDYLIRSLLPLAGDDRVQPWLRTGCREILTGRSAELDLRSFEPALVKVAAVALGNAGTSADVDLLAKHLGSNNPGVARESWKSIVRLDPVAARTVAQRSLAAGGLRPEVRSMLEEYLDQPANGGNAGTR